MHHPPDGSWVDYVAGWRRPHFVWVNSEWTRQASLPRQIWSGLPQRRVFPPLWPFQSSVIRESRRSGEPVVILQMSRLQPWKGHALLIRALSRLDRQMAWRCRIAGRPEDSAGEAYLEYLK